MGKEVNAKFEKYFWGLSKLPQAPQKVYDENEKEK